MAPVPNSVRVRKRVTLAGSHPLGIPRAGGDDDLQYVDYLVLLHSIMRASVPLMEVAHDRLGALVHGDPLAAGLRTYFEQHIEEEAGHDEWLLEDLETIGVDRADVLRRLPSPHVAAAVGAQYYWIHHDHPVSLLGYIAVLEGQPPTPESIRAWRERTAFPPAAFRTLEQHAAVDPTHNDDLDALIDSLPLSPREVASICTSALATLLSLTLALDDVRSNTRAHER